MTPRDCGTLTARCGVWLRLLVVLVGLLCAVGVHAQTPPADGNGPEPPPAGADGPPATTFTLQGAPAGAEVVVDGKSIGTTPLSSKVEVTPGPHELKVTRRGFSSYTREFTAYQSRMVTLEIDMVPTHMLMQLRTRVDGAQVFVDDELRGETPIELDLRPGPHQILVRRPNYFDQSFSVVAVAGENVERELQLEEKPEQRLKEQAARPKERRLYNRWWVWTLGAVGAVGIATAIIIPTVLSQRSDCDKLGGEVCFPILLQTGSTMMPAALTGSLTRVLSVRF